MAFLFKTFEKYLLSNTSDIWTEHLYALKKLPPKLDKQLKQRYANHVQLKLNTNFVCFRNFIEK